MRRVTRIRRAFFYTVSTCKCAAIRSCSMCSANTSNANTRMAHSTCSRLLLFYYRLSIPHFLLLSLSPSPPSLSLSQLLSFSPTLVTWLPLAAAISKFSLLTNFRRTTNSAPMMYIRRTLSCKLKEVRELASARPVYSLDAFHPPTKSTASRLIHGCEILRHNKATVTFYVTSRDVLVIKIRAYKGRCRVTKVHET